MRKLRQLDRYRSAAWERRLGGKGNDYGGAFVVPSPDDNAPLHIVAGNGAGWDHVSVSRVDRCPSWEEMEHVKRLFFKADEVAMQIHVPESEHISFHPHCLHIWRPHRKPIPTPPAIMVGPR